MRRAILARAPGEAPAKSFAISQRTISKHVKMLVSQQVAISEVVDALVLIWAASDAGEWRNRIVNIPES